MAKINQSTKDLWRACEEGDAEGARRSMAEGADATALNLYRFDALMLAAIGGHSEIVKILLPAGDARAKGMEGATALILAAANGSARALEVLLPASDAMAADSYGRTALMAAACGGWTDMVRIPGRGRQPSEAMDCARSVEILMAASDCAAKDNEGWTALAHAAVHGQAELAGLLLAGGGARARDRRGRTALMLAAGAEGGGAGDGESVRRLLAAGGADDVDGDGMTALMHAAASGSFEAVELLMADSDLDAVEAGGLSASALAKRTGHGGIASMLAAFAAVKREAVEIAGASSGGGGNRSRRPGL